MSVAAILVNMGTRFVTLTFVVIAALAACGKHMNNGGPDAAGTGIDAPGNPNCIMLGQTGANPGDCCSGNFRPVMHLCAIGPCGAARASLAAGPDCCSSRCVGN